MQEVYDRQALEKLGIYELRNIARKIGVACPTMLKKELLINRIVGIITGVDKPNEKNNKQGRPAKEISSLKDVLDIFVPVKKDKTEDFHNKIILSGNVDVLMQSIPETNINEENAHEIEGYLHIYQEGYGSIFKNSIAENVYVPAPQINHYNLKEGDKIKGFYNPHGKDNLLILIKINYINNMASDCYNHDREDFIELTSQFADRQLNLACSKSDAMDFRLIDLLCPIGRGNKCLIEYEKNYDIVEFIKRIINNFTVNDNLQTLCLAPDELYENVDYINNFSKNLTVLSKNLTIGDLNNEEDFSLVYEHYLRLAELGFDVVIIIENIEKLIDIFENHYLLHNQGSEIQAKAHAINKIKQIILNSKQAKDSGSITIFVFAEKSFNSLNMLHDIFNNKIYLLNNQVVGSSNFDFENSICTKPQLILSNTDYQNYKNIIETESVSSKKEMIKEILK